MPAILFVCLGNICRSPAAEEICRQLGKETFPESDLKIASCGLGDWHVGQLPDARMRTAARKRGYELKSRAQQFETSFFHEFDYILAVDHAVVEELKRLAKTEREREKVQLITRFSPAFPNAEIPDPYYRGQEGFEEVMDMCEDACGGLLQYLQNQ